jgi:hypothetical protein
LLSEAEKKLLALEKLSPGSGQYNLACVAALRGREDECRQELEASLRHNTCPRRSHVESDPHLEVYRESPWFKDFLKRIPE